VSQLQRQTAASAIYEVAEPLPEDDGAPPPALPQSDADTDEDLPTSGGDLLDSFACPVCDEVSSD